MIMNLIGGGGASSSKLQVKDVAPSANQQIILPDSGYDGLSKVNLSAIPNDYVGPNVNRRSGGWYSPSTSNTTIYNAGTYITSDVILTGDSALVPSNIKSGVSIFGVSGSYVGEGTWNIAIGLPSTNGVTANIPYEPTYIEFIGDFPTIGSLETLYRISATNNSGSWNSSNAYYITKVINSMGQQVAGIVEGPSLAVEYRNGTLYIGASIMFEYTGGSIYYR